MQAVELSEVGSSQWQEVVAGEQQPWGGEGEQLEWGPKERHVGIRDGSGRLLALAGLVAARVEIDGRELPVVGFGGVIVTAARRGRGLARPLLERTVALARELGPERGMLFCEERLMSLYAKFGFVPIEASVSAQQSAGEVQMPIRAMWIALAPGADWPSGAVRVLGLPF